MSLLNVLRSLGSTTKFNLSSKVRLASQLPIVKRKIIWSPDATEVIGPYSQAVQVDTTLYVSGQLGLDPKTGNFPSNDVEEQTTQLLKNLGAILKAAGIWYQNVIQTTVLLTDMNDYAKVNEIYSKYFTSNQPARVAYQVDALPKGAKVEIKATAVVGTIVDE